MRVLIHAILTLLFGWLGAELLADDGRDGLPQRQQS